MKLTYYFTLAAFIILASLWFIGVSYLDLAIVLLLFSSNAAFQLWVRGNVRWSESVNFDVIKRRLPVWAYEAISLALLLASVYYVSKITH